VNCGAMLAVYFSAVLAACGGGGGSEIAGPGEVPDTPSAPAPAPAPAPQFTGLPDFASAGGVVGQLNFESNEENQGGTLGAATLAEPVGIAVSAEGMVFVADSLNRRVMVYRELPRSLGQSADFVLGQLAADRDDYFADDDFDKPVAVAVGAGKVAVADSVANRVLIYDVVPSDGTARPVIVVGQPNLLSNNLTCDGATLFSPRAVQITPDGKLIVADSGHSRVLIWKSVAELVNGMEAHVVLGQPAFDRCERNAGATAPSRESMDEPEAIWSDGTRLAVADTFNDRVLLWDEIVTFIPTGQLPSRVLGQIDFDSEIASVPAADSLKRPRAVTSNGTHLAVGDNSNNRVLLWDSWPTEMRQPATTVLGQRDMSRNLENDGLSPTAETLDGPAGLAFHQDKLLVVDRDNHRVLIYQSR
jgi:hypothetical protein